MRRVITFLFAAAVVLVATAMVLPTTIVYAWHDLPSTRQLGLDNAVGAYLHEKTNGGMLFADMSVVCHTRPRCDPADQTALVTLYASAKARAAGATTEAEGFLGVGVFAMREDGSTLGKLQFYVFPDGTKWEQLQGGVEV